MKHTPKLHPTYWHECVFVKLRGCIIVFHTKTLNTVAHALRQSLQRHRTAFPRSIPTAPPHSLSEINPYSATAQPFRDQSLQRHRTAFPRSIRTAPPHSLSEINAYSATAQPFRDQSLQHHRTAFPISIHIAPPHSLSDSNSLSATAQPFR